MLSASVQSACLTFCSILPLLLLSSNAQNCTWTDHANSIGEQSDATPVADTITNIDDCKDQCTGTCVAIEYRIPLCSLYTTLSGFSTGQGSTYSIKECPVDSTTQPSTSAATTTQPSTSTATTTQPSTSTATTTQPPSSAACSMTQISDMKVLPEPVDQVSASLAECKELCNNVQQCQAISYGQSTCILHYDTSSVTTAPVSGYSYAVRMNCLASDSNCCYSNEETDTQGTSTDSTSVTVELTLDSCKALCVAVSSCQAVTFSGSTCNLFTSAPPAVSEIGSTYYSKSCDNGASGELTIDDSCRSASAGTTQLSTMLCFWPAVTVILTILV